MADSVLIIRIWCWFLSILFNDNDKPKVSLQLNQLRIGLVYLHEESWVHSHQRLFRSQIQPTGFLPPSQERKTFSDLQEYHWLFAFYEKNLILSHQQILPHCFCGGLVLKTQSILSFRTFAVPSKNFFYHSFHMKSHLNLPSCWSNCKSLDSSIW